MIYLLILGCFTKPRPQVSIAEKSITRRVRVVEEIHGKKVRDPYRWLEDSQSPEVKEWTLRQNQHFQVYTDLLPQQKWMYERFQSLWRYDDMSVPSPCLLDKSKEIFSTKSKDQDKWVFYLKTGDESKVVLDPNKWKDTETVSGFFPSPDCKMLAFGKANAGDENSVISVMDIESGEILPDKLRGWKQRSVSWSYDNSGFFYSAWPTAEEAPNHHGEPFLFLQ